MSVAGRVRDIVLPLLSERDVELYDLEVQGPLVRVVIDRRSGVDLDALADVTRAVSRALDDVDPIAGRYTLEITSPGLERTLRTPAHFVRALGETVKIRTVTGVGDDRRVQGVLTAADDEGVSVRTGVTEAGDPIERYLAHGQIERARTVFEWGPSDGGTRPARSAAHPRKKRTHGS